MTNVALHREAVRAARPAPRIEFDAANHLYTVDGRRMPSVTQILKAFDRGFDFVSADVLRAKADIGTAVHKACELDDLGTLDERSLDESVRPYLEQYRLFRDHCRVTVLAIEHVVYSRLHGFIGANDRLLRTPKFRCAVVDVKTGIKRGWHQLQTAGYAVAAEAPEEADAVDGRFCLYLSPDQYRLDPHTDVRDRAVFLNFVQAYHWMSHQGALPS